ncbi:MAG TPA: ABC transporter ATP-binding protein [Lachnospiraceae bacterium]
MAFLEVSHVKKIYGEKGRTQTEALKEVDFSVEKGEFIAIMGESGSGKTTLLNILATLDRPSKGQVMLEGRDISQIKDKEVAAFRRNELGFVFQDFHLLESFSNRDNIYLPLVLSGKSEETMKKKVESLAGILGIEEFLDRYPFEISGGQKQRIAFARALMNEPRLLLADEPTGALDSKSAKNIMELMERIHKEGQTIFMVTHSVKSAAFASRVLFIKDGIVYHEIYKGDCSRSEFAEKIHETLVFLEEKGELS